MVEDPRDSYFNPNSNFRAEFGEKTEADRQISFESTIFKQIVTGLGRNPAVWRVMEEQCREETGSPTLMLSWLPRVIPDCPVQFGSAKIRRTHAVTVDDLFNRFTKTKIFQAYKEFLVGEGLSDQTDKVAFVFNWAVSRHVMVMHNLDRDTGMVSPASEDVATHGTRIVHYYGNPLVVYTLEPLTKFLLAIRHEWNPTVD